MEIYKTLDLIKWGEKELSKFGVECALHDANALMRYSQDTDSFRNCIEKRASRYPLQYILKETEFMGLNLRMTEGVFIPRQETEILIEKTLELAKGMESSTINILEIGTGSGNIAISLTRNITNCRIIASDISDVALETAFENAEMNTVSRQIEFIKSDLFDSIPDVYLGRFDIIVSNPPYVKRGEIKQLQPEIAYEDVRTLDGGIDGLDFYRSILAGGRRYLKAGGMFAFEIGDDQAAAVSEIVERYSELGSVKIFKDYSGHDRIAIVKK